MDFPIPMDSPIPHVAVGEKATTELMRLIECYLAAHSTTVDGTVVNTSLANEAVDWWNKLSDVEKLKAAMKYRGGA